MSSKGWLSKEDFNKLDDLFSKLGYGGYYDFLECLKEIGSNIGAYTVEGGEVDREGLKTIREVMAYLDYWSNGIFQYRSKMSPNFQFDEDILKLLQETKQKR